jgi:hypothetical protein
MIKKLLIAVCLLINLSFAQNKTRTYYIVAKGLYIHWQEKSKRIKVPYKENESFYFSIKNDSTALIQEIHKGKPKEITEYKISPNCDTAYVKRNPTVNGKRKMKVEKIIYQKVY